MEPKKIILKTGGNDFDLSLDQVGDWFRVCYQYGWSLAPSVQGLTGAPIYTFEVSDDGTTPFNYKELATDVSIEDSLCDTHLNYLYARVSTVSNGGSGTAQFNLILKDG